MAERRRLCLFLIDEANDYQAALRAEAEQVSRRYRAELRVFSAQNRSSKQVEQVRNAISGEAAERPDAVLVSPVSEVALLSLIHGAARNNIAWVFLNRWHDSVADLRRQYSEVPIFAATADQVQVGEVQGSQVQHLVRPGDELLYIQGPLGTSSAKARVKGLQQALSTTDLPVTTFHSDWTQAGGKSVMTQWLEMLPQAVLPGFIVAAQNDAMALGAREAIVEWSSGRGMRIENVDILGCDGSPSFGQRMVSMGQLTATVVIPPVAGAAIDTLQRFGAAGGTSSADLKVPVQPFPAVGAIRSLRG